MVKYVTYFLVACVLVSNGTYLYYLGTGGHMVRLWSGINGILLGLFMLSLAMLQSTRHDSRWIIGLYVAVGVLNIAVGAMFFR